MSAVTELKDLSKSERVDSVGVDPSLSTFSGRSFSFHECSDNELLLAIQKAFDLNVDSIDLRGVVFGETFGFFVKMLKEHSTIKKITLTASKLTESQVQAVNELASERKELLFFGSEGGLIGGAHTNFPLYYKEHYEDVAELQDVPKLRKTPFEGIKIYKARYKRVPRSSINLGAANGLSTIALMLEGCKNIDAIDASESQGVLFAEKLQKLNMTETAEKANVRYHVCEFTKFNRRGKRGVDFFISNYVWSYRAPNRFKACFQKSVESVAEDGLLCGEFFGKPPTPPGDGVTFHTFDETIQVLQTFNLEILYFEIEPHEVSLKRKDAAIIPWGDLYRVVAAKTTPKDIESSSYEKVKEVLNKAILLNQPRIYTILESVT